MEIKTQWKEMCDNSVTSHRHESIAVYSGSIAHQPPCLSPYLCTAVAVLGLPSGSLIFCQQCERWRPRPVQTDGRMRTDAHKLTRSKLAPRMCHLRHPNKVEEEVCACTTVAADNQRLGQLQQPCVTLKENLRSGFYLRQREGGEACGANRAANLEVVVCEQTTLGTC